MTTARTLINDALIEIGTQDPGESISAEIAAYALRTLNRVINRLNLQSVYTYSRQEFALASGTASYTFGTGGNFNSADNGVIRRAGLLRTDTNTETDLDLIDYRAFADIADRASTGMPAYLYDAKTGPLNTLTFWPKPDSNLYKVVLYTDKEIAELADLDASLAAPNVYEELILTELAIALAGPLKAMVPDSLVLRNRKAWEATTNDNQLSMPFNPTNHWKPVGGRADVKIGRLI